MKTTLLITPEKPALVLRVCQPDGCSRNGFVWPTSGPVTCPDWVENEECGNGLHGWLNGEGESGAARSTMITNPKALWLVVEVPVYIQLDGKVKFPAGTVVCSGDPLKVSNYLLANGCAGAFIGGVVIGHTATVGNYGTATAGERGTATAEIHGTATAGIRGTAKAGNAGTATAGYRGTATAGCRGAATAGDQGTATAGYRGTATAGKLGVATTGGYGSATAGWYGIATAGDHGIAITGDYGTPTAGDHGIAITDNYGRATAGRRGKASAGIEGQILLTAQHSRHLISGLIGIDKDANGDLLQAGIPYHLNEADRFHPFT